MAAETAEAGLERSIRKRGARKSHRQEEAVCLREMPKGCGWQGEQNAGREGRWKGMRVRCREPGVSLSGVCSLTHKHCTYSSGLEAGKLQISDFFWKEKAPQCGGAVAASQAPLSLVRVASSLEKCQKGWTLETQLCLMSSLPPFLPPTYPSSLPAPSLSI